MTTPSLRAHLLRATHEWLTEHGHTPYVQVLVDRFVQVPVEHVRDGSIVLNMSYDSTNKLLIGDDWIEFQARFNGQVRNLLFPTDHVISLFSKETQEGYQGMTSEEFQAIRAGNYQLPAQAESVDAATSPEAASSKESGDVASISAIPKDSKKPVFTRVK